MFFLFLASFQVIPRIPHPSLVCPDHREKRGPWGLVGKKDRMIENTQNVECLGMQFGDG